MVSINAAVLAREATEHEPLRLASAPTQRTRAVAETPQTHRRGSVRSGRRSRSQRLPAKCTTWESCASPQRCSASSAKASSRTGRRSSCSLLRRRRSIGRAFGTLARPKASDEDIDPDGSIGIFVSEYRLGFGCSASSNICQRFAHALAEVFRKLFDAEEKALLAHETDPARLAFLECGARWDQAKIACTKSAFTRTIPWQCSSAPSGWREGCGFGVAYAMPLA